VPSRKKVPERFQEKVLVRLLLQAVFVRIVRLLLPLLLAGVRGVQGVYRRIASKDLFQGEVLERWQPAAPHARGQESAASVGDLGPAEVEHAELRQRFSLRRRRICRRRRHERGEALVAEWVVSELKPLQRGPPPQGRREGHQTRVADGGGVQIEYLEPRQGASVQGGRER